MIQNKETKNIILQFIKFNFTFLYNSNFAHGKKSSNNGSDIYFYKTEIQKLVLNNVVCCCEWNYLEKFWILKQISVDFKFLRTKIGWEILIFLRTYLKMSQKLHFLELFLLSMLRREFWTFPLPWHNFWKSHLNGNFRLIVKLTSKVFKVPLFQFIVYWN